MDVSSVINLNLVKHPLNWLIILSMVLIVGFTLHLVLSHYSGDSVANPPNVTPSVTA